MGDMADYINEDYGPCEYCGKDPGNWSCCGDLEWDGDPGVGLEWVPICIHPDRDDEDERDCFEIVEASDCFNGYIKCQACDALICTPKEARP